MAVKGTIHGAKEYGLLCDLEAHPDVVGLVAPPHFLPETVKTEGAPITAVVLDVSKKDGIVDLSLRPELVARALTVVADETRPDVHHTSKKKQKKKKQGPGESNAEEQRTCKVGEEIQVTVELVKSDEGYCIVSLPAGHATWIGFLSTSDFNLPPAVAAAQQPQVGDTFSAIVAGDDVAEDRLILVLPRGSGVINPTNISNPSKSTNKDVDGSLGKKKKLPQTGTVSNARVDGVHLLHADVTLECGARGRIFITEAADPGESPGESPDSSLAAPLAALTTGSSVRVVVLGRMQTAEGRRHGLLELSCRPSVVHAAAAARQTEGAAEPKMMTWASLKAGQQLQGYVQEVSGEYIWVVFSPVVRGRAFIPHTVSSLDACAGAAKAFKPGLAVTATVLSVNDSKHALDVSLAQHRGGPALVPGATASTALGCITAADGMGIHIALGPGQLARVPLTEIHDKAVSNALHGLHRGQFVQVAVLGESKNNYGKQTQAKNKLVASLRPSQGGICDAHACAIAPDAHPSSDPPPPPGNLSLADLKPGQRVHGYVKSTGTNGVFVCLARDIDARIRLRQLSDEFIEDPAKVFPPGSHIEGTVIAVEGGRVDLTLRSRGRRLAPLLDSIEEGHVVHGRVKRVETFGVFIELDGGSGACGLAHVSELADGFVRDVAQAFKVDQRTFTLFCVDDFIH